MGHTLALPDTRGLAPMFPSFHPIATQARSRLSVLSSLFLSLIFPVPPGFLLPCLLCVFHFSAPLPVPMSVPFPLCETVNTVSPAA
jgi:hypothetical protein